MTSSRTATHHLVRALKTEGDPPTVRQVFDVLAREVPKQVALEKKGAPQHPQLSPKDGRGEVPIGVVPVNKPSTQELLLFFARTADQLPTSIRPSMDSASTRIIVAAADRIGGSKDLVLEVDSAPPGSGVDARTPIGPSPATGASFVVNRSGQQPVVVKIRLKHQ